MSRTAELSARRLRLLCTVVVLGLGALPAASTDGELRSASSFDGIADDAERSAAIFEEASRALLHPRCVNCHPAGDSPLQGESGGVHEPPVRRGRGGLGAIGMRCGTCHQRENFDPARVPGAPHWRLAPASMAWEGLDPAELCAQLKDPRRNGGRSLDKIFEHFADDALVGWGWAPGADREPVPSSQEELAGLIRAWVESGAACPR